MSLDWKTGRDGEGWAEGSRETRRELHASILPRVKETLLVFPPAGSSLVPNSQTCGPDLVSIRKSNLDKFLYLLM